MRYIEYAIALSTMTQELTESNKHRHEYQDRAIGLWYQIKTRIQVFVRS